jgi:hypothetical protein
MISDRGRNSTENAGPAEPLTESATRAERARFDDSEDDYSDYDFDPIYYD